MSFVEDLIKKCRSVSLYNTQKVSEEDLLKALEYCLWAPNHRKTHPWRIYWPKNEMRSKLNYFLAQMKFLKPEQIDQLHSFEQRLSKISEILIFSSLKGEDEIQTRENYATVCCSIQLFALQLAAKDIGYKWVTPQGFNDGKLHEFLSTSLDVENIVGIIWVGYPENEVKLTQRPNLNTVLKQF